MSKYFYIGEETTVLDLVNLAKLQKDHCAIKNSYMDLLEQVNNEELCSEVCEAFAEEYWGEDIPVQDSDDVYYYYDAHTDVLCILGICNDWGSALDILIGIVDDLLLKQLDNPMAKAFIKTTNSSVTKTANAPVNTSTKTPIKKPEASKDILSYSFID